MRCMLFWITLIVNWKCCETGDRNFIYNFQHSGGLYVCEVKDKENTDIHCYGNLAEIPTNLSKNLRKLSVSNSRIERFAKSFLDPYRKTLKDM